MKIKLDYLLVLAGVIILCFTIIYWDDFYTAYQPFIWIAGIIAAPYFISFIYLWAKHSKLPSLYEIDCFIKSALKKIFSR